MSEQKWAGLVCSAAIDNRALQGLESGSIRCRVRASFSPYISRIFTTQGDGVFASVLSSNAFCGAARLVTVRFSLLLARNNV